MLFAQFREPHGEHDLATKHPEPVNQAMGYLSEWYHQMAVTSRHDEYPVGETLR